MSSSPSLIPSLSNVVKVKLENGPKGVGNKGGIAGSAQPVGVRDDSSGTQSGSI